MKIQKFNEEIEYDISEMISAKFFEDSGNFGSEELKVNGDFNIMKFYFPIIEDEELDKIMECKNFIINYVNFYISKNNNGLILNITISEKQKEELLNKFELDKTANKYNL